METGVSFEKLCEIADRVDRHQIATEEALKMNLTAAQLDELEAIAKASITAYELSLSPSTVLELATEVKWSREQLKECVSEINKLRARLADAIGLLESAAEGCGDWYINFPYDAQVCLDKLKEKKF